MNTTSISASHQPCIVELETKATSLTQETLQSSMLSLTTLFSLLAVEDVRECSIDPALLALLALDSVLQSVINSQEYKLYQQQEVIILGYLGSPTCTQVTVRLVLLLQDVSCRLPHGCMDE